MSPTADPWTTLGLSPGASADDVRRAYRRLAKANHPDAAGEAALPRFLAIQAAYEQLVGPAARRRPARPGARPGPGDPWRADTDRARASGRADGRRPGARPGATAGPATGDGRGTASDGTRESGPAGASRPATGAAGSRSERRPDGAARAGAPGDGASGSGGAAGPSSTSDAAGGPRGGRASRRGRAPNKATPYSTSYDPADDEPFEPGWSGATWYGASSGTYWTMNPKEYADPRKHGPEYQRRARRSSTGWILDDETAGDVPPAEPLEPAAPGGGASAAPPASHTAAPPGRTSAHRPDTTANASANRHPGDGADGATPPPASVPRAAGAADDPGDAAAVPGRRWAVRTLLEPPRRGLGRLGVALLGWPPLGLAAASAIGETTGCGRFAASCAELSAPGTWVVQVAIVVLLLALPRVAAWSVHGSIAVLVVGVPAAVVLSAGGGARQPDASASVLAGLTAVAWVVGVAYGAIASLLAERRPR